jgi:hypothetical protein
MNSGELDRQQIRHAIRNMGDEYVFYLLDDAISLLSQAQLRQLIAPYADPEQFAGDAPNENLLSGGSGVSEGQLGRRILQGSSRHNVEPGEEF